MPDPSPEVVAAALALADSADHFVRTCASYGPASDAIEADNRLTADVARYRAAIAPKLRTRAEVDAEMVSLMRDRCGRSGTLKEDQQLWIRFNELAREPTAPEPAESGKAR